MNIFFSFCSEWYFNTTKSFILFFYKCILSISLEEGYIILDNLLLIVKSHGKQRFLQDLQNLARMNRFGS